MIVQFRNEKVSNHGSIPITIDCNVVAFIVFEEGFHQPIKRTKQSVFDVAIQPEVRFIAKQNSLMKIGNNGNLVLGPFDESTPCLMIVLMNCQTKLRINHLTAVKSVAILEKLFQSRFHGQVLSIKKGSWRDILKHGPTKLGPRVSASVGASYRSQIKPQHDHDPKIVYCKMLYLDISTENLGTINYMPTSSTELLCDDCRPYLRLGQPHRNSLSLKAAVG
ncbi:alpha-2 adrenergic receptor [Trichonephila clavipes]|nr:alpha-2 adrenergic receptor [Trichonephila clavipes]